MRIVDLQNKLTAAARRETPDERVPYAFEKRIMARLTGLPKVDFWSLWSRGLWRAVAPCVGVMLVLSVWTLYTVRQAPVQQVRVVELEHAVLAPLDTLGEVW